MATTSGIKSKSSTSKQSKQHGSVCVAMANIRCLHTMVFERLRLPKQVELFNEFEELCKMYSIDLPFLPRSQVELVFDVFDGKKLQSANLLDDLLEENDELGATSGAIEQQQQQQEAFNGVAGKPFEPQTISGQKPTRNSSTNQFHANRLNKLNSSSSNYKAATKNKPGNQFSWSKLLSKRTNRMQLKCCLAKSETSQEICLSPSNSSTTAFISPILLPSNNNNNNATCEASPEWTATATTTDSNEALNVALSPDSNDDQDDVELKAEVLQLMSPLISEMRRCSTLSEIVDNDFSSSPEQQQQQQNMILDTAFDSSHVSICLFDKQSRLIKLKNEAENGRRWAKIKSRLNELCFKLTGSIQTNSLSIQTATTTAAKSTKSAQQSSGIHESVESRLNKLENKVNKFIKYRMSSIFSQEKYTIHERINKIELEQLIDLTKNSLNHLIDAQLLLRNKLTSEQQQQYNNSGQQQQLLSSATTYSYNNFYHGNDYEILLKNNFNLLKIWQNIEETKRLVCFVCEPIKANLNDLFWFSRKRAVKDLSISTTTTTTSTTASPFSTYLEQCLLSSPLISLDGIQVKRGLLQVSLSSLYVLCLSNSLVFSRFAYCYCCQLLVLDD